MAAIGHNLMIRFGLSRAATDAESTAWANRVRVLIAAGNSASRAVELAAAELLPGYKTHFYASEGDTVEMLLQRLNDK